MYVCESIPRLSLVSLFVSISIHFQGRRLSFSFGSRASSNSIFFNLPKSFPVIRASSSGFSYSLDTGTFLYSISLSTNFRYFHIITKVTAKFGGFISKALTLLFSGSGTELEAVSTFSEIVPDTVIFDDFEKYPFSLLIFYSFYGNFV